MKLVSVCTLALLAFTACSKDPPPATQTTAAAQPATVEAKNTPATLAGPVIAADAPNAEIGKAAPDFTLKDLDGKETKLSAFKGKVVVLEWFNPGCPFVKKSHSKGSLKEAAAKHGKAGVVWLSINSSAGGKEGSGAEANKAGVTKFGMTNPVLLDETGAVGKKYGATNTPHMFVIDASGTLAYSGAIDNSPDGEGETPTDGKLISYVDEAVSALAAGKPVATAKTKAYGCSVKYAH